MKITDIKRVDVFYKERKVGTLVENSDGTTSFAYSDKWIENGFSISPFKLPLSKTIFHCSDYLINNLFGVFYDSLPDSWGNLLIDEYLISQGYNPKNVSMVQRLTLLDDNSLGALTYKPSFSKEKEIVSSLEFDEFKKKIDAFLKDGDISNDNFFDIYKKGHSTGGSRPKINFLFEDGLYIVKFKSKLDIDSIGKEEYNLNLFAKECGINVPKCKLISSKICDGYFATKRFDRDNNEKVHVISLAGLFDLRTDLSQIHYKGFLQVVNKLCPMDAKEAVKRMIFNYLIDNKDDHPRNFSFTYDEKNKQYRLSPFYDITSTPQIKEHMMQVNGKDNPTLEDFIEDAKACHISSKEVEEIYFGIKNKLINK